MSGSSVSWSPITSSFTKSLNPASRPAARSASPRRRCSSRRCWPAGSSGRRARWWRMPSSLVRSRSTRRTATVTTSAPEASMARTISSLSRYLPVPTMSRERKRVAADVERSVGHVAGGCRRCVGHGRKDNGVEPTPAHEVHQLDDVALGHRRVAPGSAGGRCARLCSTTTVRGSSPRCASRSARVAGPGTPRGSPLTMMAQLAHVGVCSTAPAAPSPPRPDRPRARAPRSPPRPRRRRRCTSRPLAA